MAMMVQTFIGLPLEMRHNILSFVEPEDLPRISLVCRALREYIESNKQLDRDVLLNFMV